MKRKIGLQNIRTNKTRVNKSLKYHGLKTMCKIKQ